MKAYFFSDLDDTLLQSERKLGANESAIPVATNKNGEFIGFSTFSQSNLFDLLNENGRLIPVTGRGSEAYSRVSLYFKDLAIVSHGAIILDSKGNPLSSWVDSIKEEAEKGADKLESLLSNVLASVESMNAQDDILAIVAKDHGFSCYLQVKQKVGEDLIKPLLELMENSIPSGWRIHQNGRQLSILPPYANKARAVRFIKEHLEVSVDDLTIGLGDSISDLEFMGECHMWMTPQNSQINKLLSLKRHSGD